MSYSRNDGRNSSLQREREREKKRREQQFMKQEQGSEDPVFSEPKKINTSRQDSLTRNIHNTLGDSRTISGILLKNQNFYLGTSRSEQGPPTPAPQNEAPVFTSSNLSKDSSNRGSVSRNPTSKQQLSSSSTANSTLKSREETINRSQKHSHHKNRRSQGGHPSSSSYKSKTGGNEHNLSTGSGTYKVPSYSSSHTPINSRNATMLDGSEKPNLISERDRVSSVDSDFCGVETIFKEMMVDCPPTLTEIKTPSMLEKGFNFVGTKRKLSGIESSTEAANAGVMDDKIASDVESSGEDSSDEDDDSFSWNLDNLKPQTQPSNPLLSSNSNIAETNTKMHNNDGGKAQLTAKSIRSEGGPPLPKDTGQQNRGQSRGRKLDKKQSSSLTSSKNRSSPASSQHSALSGDRTDQNSGENFSSLGPSHEDDYLSKTKKPNSKISARKVNDLAASQIHLPHVYEFRNSQNKISSSRNHSEETKTTSRVSKETISSTTETNAKRWPSVGRKGPSTGHSTPAVTNPPGKAESPNGSESDRISNHESDEDINMSSDSNSDSSSDSGSNTDEDPSDIEDEDKLSDDNEPLENNEWSLSDIRASAEQNPQTEIQDKIETNNQRNSDSGVSKTSVEKQTMSTNYENKPDRWKLQNEQHANVKKHGRKSSSSSLTPSGNAPTENEGVNKPPSRKRDNSTVHSSTVDRTNTKGSKNAWKTAVTHRDDNHDVGETKPPSREDFLYPELLVRIRSTLLGLSGEDTTNKKFKLSKNASALSRTSSSESTSVHAVPQKRTFTTVSTGSETEQPIRKANCVQVAVADSQDLVDNCNTATYKRKHAVPDRNYEEDARKRQRRDKAKLKQTSPRSATFSQNSKHKGSTNVDQWQDSASVESSHREESHNDRTTYPSTNHTQHVVGTPRQESPTSNDPSKQSTAASSASFVLPDSSVPGEQERIQTSDWYMREGKRMKHEGDGMVDSRNGRTRAGEAMNRALAYFEASLFFIICGSVMETENREDRLEVSSNSSWSASHSPNNMYQQTIPLLDFVLKMRPHVEQDDRIFKRIMISCLRCQAVLYLRIFKLKKDVAVKYSELLTDQFKSMSKSNRTPSPWHHTNSAPNVVSPMSPAVPSPFGHHGPSPASTNVEQVSSSTQAGKMTPPTHAGYSFPQKMFDMYRQHHTIMCNLLQAHEKWDQGENMLEEHVDFFRNIDTLCNRTLTFHSNLRDVFLYHKMVLHQLRTLTANSPRE
ncbi:uncharacterized protein LOC120341549 isoform X1 [Styela clava]